MLDGLRKRLTRALYRFASRRGDIGPGGEDLGTCCVPGCDRPAEESWMPNCCALREAGVSVDWVHVCAEHDVELNERITRGVFGDRYDAELAAYRERRLP